MMPADRFNGIVAIIIGFILLYEGLLLIPSIQGILLTVAGMAFMYFGVRKFLGK